MGLDLSVGLLASAHQEGEQESITAVEQIFDDLNAVLCEAREPRHEEPAQLGGPIFEAQMWGYGGLHNLRRMAAHFVYERALVPPSGYLVGSETSSPHLQRLYDEHTRAAFPPSGIRSLFRRKPQVPPFEHLIMHSDCEGFYLPRQLDRVVVDHREPQRPGLGGFVGSSAQLLAECKSLAALIDLPADLDHEDEELWEVAEQPRSDGPLWHQYGIEAFCLRRLIVASEYSLTTGAALFFN